jgi:hypothetical protein
MASGCFRTQWSESDHVQPLHLPVEPAAARTVSFDEDWIDLIGTRLAARRCTTIIAPAALPCEQVLATLAAARPEIGWELTFVVGTDRHPDGVLLRIVQAGSPAADRLAAADEGMVLSLADSPPPRAGVAHEPDTNEDESVPLRLEAPDRIPPPLLVLAVVAILLLGGAIATIGGWFQ